MKKRLLSLLLAVVLCIGLLPVGALAADGDVTVCPDVFDEDGDVVKASEVTNPWFKRAGPVYSGSEGADTLSGQYYIVQNDVTIKGNLTVDGSNGGLVLCAGATLTIEGALILSNNNDFHIYGETTTSGNTGKLVINNSGDGAAIQSDFTYGGSLAIHSGNLEINSASGSLVKNITLRVENTNQNQNGPIYTVMKATRTDASGSKELKYEDWAGLAADKTDLTGSTLVIEYCKHTNNDEQEYITDKETDADGHWHHRHCTTCGFSWASEQYPLAAVPVDKDTHKIYCDVCENYVPKTEAHTEPATVKAVPTEDGKGHTNKVCGVCDYALGEPEAHTYIKNTNGSCDTCDFTPFMSDSEGNLYDKDSYQEAFEKAADSNGAVTLTLVSEVTGEGANIWTNSIEFNYPGKSVTLDMGGITLSSTGEAALLVSGGELIIQNAATLEGASASGELSSTPAIKVTDGALTFNGTVNATGGAKNSSAAPAILVEGGTVTFGQTVTATAAENDDGADNAAAPAIKISGGKVIFNGDVTAKGGLRGKSGNLLYCEPAILANGGELDFNGDLDLNGGLTITNDAKLTKGLTKGKFQIKYLKADGTAKSVSGDRVSVEGSNVYKNAKLGNVNKLLADDHIFVNLDQDDKNNYYFTTSREALSGWDVTIMYHEHDFKADKGYECVCGVSCDHSAGYENGKCKTCGKPCSHLRLGTGDRDCLDCGQRMIARIITKNNEGYDLPTYYSDLPTALNAAKNGETVTLLDNIDQSNKTACLTGDGKTVTLNLNGKNITGGWIYVGIDQDGTVINSSRLNITGSGSFDGMIGISAKGTLDLSAWDGGTIRTVDLSKSGDDECKLIVGEKAGTIQTLKIYNWPTDQNSSITYINKTKLRGGSYDNISITMKSENGATRYIPYGSMLAPGYAFQYADGSGSFVNYATKATYDAGGVIYNVKVVKCTTHVDAKRVDADGNITDGADNLCDYCNADLTAATVATLTVGGATYYYTDLPSALKAASSKGGTVTLQKDVENVSQMLVIEGSLHVTLDLNGKKITGDGSSTLLGISNLSDVTICDSSESKAGQIKCTASGYAVYVSEGCDLTISGGTFEGTDGATTSAPGYAVGVDGAKLIITGGTFNSPVDAKDKLIVSGGTFNGAVTINARGATITGGTFNGAFSMSAQPDVFSGGTFTQQAVFSSVSNILTGGEFQKGIKSTDKKLYELLAENKAYQTADDWLDDNTTYFYNDTGSSVTVAEAPIHSVTLTVNGNSVALDEDNKGRFSVELGTDVTLTASCEGSMEAPYVTWSPTLGGEEDGGTGNPVKQGTGKSLSYTLPPEDLTVGTHTYRVSFCSKDPGSVGQVTGYYKVAQITITVTKIDIAKVPESQIELELVYGGNVPYDITGATNADGVHATTMALSPVEPFKVNDTELTTNDYTLEGNVQYGVGEYTLKINVNTAIYTGSIERTWHVIPRKLGLPGFPQGDYEKTYDGGTALPKSITDFNGYFEAGGKDFSLSPTVLKQSDYTLTNGAFENATVGEDKRINFTIQLTNKNYEFNTSYIEALAKDGITVTADSITYTNCIMPRSVHFNITPDTMPDFDKAVTLEVINDLENTYTIDLPALPALESPRTYGDITYTVASQSLEHGYATLGQPTVKQVDGKYQLCLTVPAVKYDQETSIGTILVKVTTTNYNDVVLTVNLNAVNKFQPAVAVQAEPKTVTYGTTLANITPVFEAIYDGQPVGGTVTWDLSADAMLGTDTKYLAWTFTPSDPDKYFGATGNASITVTPATLTGAPKYTAITASGKKLSDAGLAANESWPVGTLQWVDKDGKALDAAATEVKANTAYQWKFTPDSKNYNPIEGSITLYSVSTGGGGSTTYPVSTPSKTENGSVSVSPKNASRGDTVTITVKPNDGYVLDDLAVTDKNGNDLKLTDKGNGKYTFTMPAGKVEVKASFAEEAETSPFADVATNAYYYEAVKWAAEQGITGGIGNNLFGPNQPCTRAQIVTFLWRAAGSPEPKDMSSFADVSTDSYYAKAVAWAVENGITSGTGDGKFSPDATCTRAQAVMFLARALNAKATSAAEFSDVPTDSYFAEAVAWAASNGVTAGIGGGLFGPNNDCTRAQIVTFLFRAYNK